MIQLLPKSSLKDRRFMARIMAHIIFNFVFLLSLSFPLIFQRRQPLQESLFHSLIHSLTHSIESQTYISANIYIKSIVCVRVRPTLGGNGHQSICHPNSLFLHLVSGVCFHFSPNLTKSKWLTRAYFSEHASFVSVYVLFTEQLTAFFAIIFQ